MNRSLLAPPFWRRPSIGLQIRLFSVAGLLAALVVTMATILRAPLKDDIAWLLYVAQQWLHGRHLYVDLVEVNPPLIVWICAFPVFLANAFSLPVKLVAMPLFTALIVGCAWWAAAILDRAPKKFGDRTTIFCVCATIMLLMPGGDFAQREHLLIAAALPYFAVLTLEIMGTPVSWQQAVPIGVLAGLGCSLKPTYGIAFGLLEVTALWYGMRRVRPAALAGAAAFALYVLAIIVLEPAYFRTAVPMAFAIYGATDFPILDLMFDSRLLLFAIAVGCVLLATQPSRGGNRVLLAVLFVFAAAATFVCIIQGKNWFYHRIPATIAAVLGLAAWTGMRLHAPLRPRWRTAGPALLAVLTLAAFGLGAYERLQPQMELAMRIRPNVVDRLDYLITREHAKSYVAFSDWITLGFPVVNNTGVTWGSRFDSMWPLDAVLSGLHQDAQTARDWPVVRWVATDFVNACPDLVVVDRRGTVDYVAFLSNADPAFLKMWSLYHRIASFDGLEVFRRSTDAAANRERSCRKVPVSSSPRLDTQ
jgi:hypothetical protein